MELAVNANASFTPISEATYSIINAETGTALTAVAPPETDPDKQWWVNGKELLNDYNKDQLWRIEQGTGNLAGKVRFVNVGQDKILGTDESPTFLRLTYTTKEMDTAPNPMFGVEGGYKWRIQTLYNGDHLIVGNDVDYGSLKIAFAIEFLSAGTETARLGQYANKPIQTWRLAPATVATIYRSIDYGGKEQSLGVGSYTSDKLKIVGNNALSSLKIAKGFKVTLYNKNNFEGNAKSFTSNNKSLMDDGWNDLATSIRVERI